MSTLRSGDLTVPWLTVGDVVRAKAREHSGAEAVAFDDGEVLTNESLNARSDWLAGALAELGVRKGDRVASLLYNSAEQLLTWLAAAKLGAVAVPINVSVRGVDLGHVLRASAPVVMVVEPELREVYESVRDEFAPRMAAEVLVGERQGGYLTFSELEAPRRGAPAVEVSPADPTCVLFTGGTTGLPKGVVRPHFSYICAALRYRQIFRPLPGDRHFSTLQLFHCGGQEIGFIGPLLNDVPCMLTRWFSAQEYWAQVRRYGGTVIDGVGPMLAVLLRQPPRPDDRDNPVRLGMGATRGIAAEARREFEERFGVKLLEMYALTETGTMLISNHIDDERAGSVGKPRGWCEVAVVDDNDRPLAPAEVGEIVLRPTLPFSMSLGYFEQTAATVDHWRNLWIHTGDIGHIDEDGWVYFTGRMAHWIRRRGENVACLEVEQVIDAHPHVVESAVFGVPAEVGEDDIKVCVVLKAEAVVSPEEIVRWCEDRLAYFKVPRYVQFVDRLPRSVTKNEIERHRLKAQGIGNAWDRQAAGYRLRR